MKKDKREMKHELLVAAKDPVTRPSLAKMGTIEEPAEFDSLVDSLPPDQKEFVTVATRFAKLWEYCNEHQIELPSDLAEVLNELPKLTHEERIALLERINEALLECQHDASQDPELRQ